VTERRRAEEALKRSEKAALRLAQEAGVIAEIGRIISSSLDIEEVYERFAEEVRKLIPFDRILLNLVNQQEGTLTTAYTAGMEVAGRRKGVVFPTTGSVTEQMMRTGAPILFQPESIGEVQNRFPGLVLSFQAGLRSRLSVPLIARGEVIGSLTLWSKQVKAYGKRDIRLAQSVASQIAGAIANAQLFQERNRAAEALKRSEKAALRLAQETGVIAGIGRIISSSLDIEEVYERFAEAVRKLVPFDLILVNLVNQQEGVMTTAYAAGMEVAGRKKGVVVPITGSVTEQMVRTGAPVLFQPESIDEVQNRFPGLVRSFQAGLRSRLSVPLIARGEVIGSLTLWSKQVKAYGKRDIRLAQSVASQIAGAIANAQLFQERNRAAEALEEANTGFKVLLKHREEDRKDLEERFVSNVKQLVLPYVEKLKKSRLEPLQATTVGFIEANLTEIFSPFLNNLRGFNFTPRQLEIVALIKEGRTTKEIAEFLHVSTEAIDMHRFLLRKKLGLNKEKTNLRSYLLSLA
jgi:GAF domain-containing protein/DNA-binding CsgD family transcriptional regulator